MRSDRFTVLDRQIAHALQIDARAPFSRIGEALGVSDQTVARRYTRLRASGALRVVGLTDPMLAGQVPWFMRVRCAPGTAQPVAQALARREDTSWVYLTSAGAELFCGVRARADEGGGEELLRRLPHTPRVLSVEAYRILHLFYGGPRSLLEKLSALSPEQVLRLREGTGQAAQGAQGAHAVQGAGAGLTGADRRLLAVLGRDARAPVAELVAATGLAAATVRRRMAELRLSGALYFDVDFDDRLFGLGLRAIMWLTVSPAYLESVGQALAGHRETAFVAATTGAAGLCVSLSCADGAALYGYLTGGVAPLRGVHHLETVPVLRAVKYAAPSDGPSPGP